MIKHFAKLMASALFLTVSLLQPAIAGEAQELDWPDLLPQLAPLKNPLIDLPDDQRLALDNISYFQSFEGDLMSGEDSADYKDAQKIAKQSRRELEKQKFNVDDFFDRYRKWENELKQRNSLTVKKLDGKDIAVAGYLLPLEFAKSGVKEFLLVPYVGACIHSPPPPINQTVFVHMNKPHKINGLFDPVVVTGRMSTKPASKKLSLVDGQNVIDAGYSLAGKNIKKYQQSK
ncbi:MAG: DUF3299 domain-containing protein [bacterium]|nr:DUF3299 domain-containing protein [bacterium]